MPSSWCTSCPKRIWPYNGLYRACATLNEAVGRSQDIPLVRTRKDESNPYVEESTNTDIENETDARI